jgi:hypothetical protein
MEKIELSVNLVNEILRYLDTRPHGEVRKFIDAIHQEAQRNRAQEPQPQHLPVEKTP